LAASGFVININKTKLTPNTRGKWLGFEIDTVSMEFSVPSHKIEHLLLMISQLIRNNNCSPKQISRVAGHIISMSIAIGPLTQLFTRNMYKFIETRDSWFTRYFLDEELEFELKFWQRALREANGFTTRIVYSDASGTGYGGYIVEKLGEQLAHGNFSNFEKDQSSTFESYYALSFFYNRSASSYKINLSSVFR